MEYCNVQEGGKFENFVLKLELKMGSITKILITVRWLYFF